MIDALQIDRGRKNGQSPEDSDGFDILDELEPLPAPTPITLDARILASRFITLTLWAGCDPARLSIVPKLIGIDDRSQAQISRQHRLSEDRINRAMRDGEDLLCGIQSGTAQQVTKRRRGKRHKEKSNERSAPN